MNCAQLNNNPKPSPCVAFQTECDITNERICRTARLKFLLQLRQYNDNTKAFFLAQRENADTLWRLSVKFNILRDACPRGIYPVAITDQVMCEMLDAKDKLIRTMHCALKEWHGGTAWHELVELYAAFQRSTKPINWSYPSALICGSSKEKPLQFYIDSALDTMYYYERLQKHIEATFRAITLFDSDSMAAFTKCLAYSEQFDQLLADLLLYGHVLMVQDSYGVAAAEEKTK